MSFPHYPDPAQRAEMLQAHLLRQQGLTYRQIGQRMDRAVSTVHGYVRDFEQFRTDLIGELAADQIATHLIQLADIDDEHYERRLASVRELRLLLGSLPEIHRGEVDRTVEILQYGVAIDRYGNRYPKPEHMYPPTEEELAQAEQPPAITEPNPDQPLAFLPEPSRTLPNEPEQETTSTATSVAPRPEAGPRPPGAANGKSAASAQTAPAARPNSRRTPPNRTERNTAPNPALNGRSANHDQNSPPPNEQPQADAVPDEILRLLGYLDADWDPGWLDDDAPYAPGHPLHQAAIQLEAEPEDAPALTALAALTAPTASSP